LDKTSTGLTLELFRSENGNEIKTISLCEIIYHFTFSDTGSRFHRLYLTTAYAVIVQTVI
jgi:hypothetical protein